MNIPPLAQAAAGGLIGAVALTALHETLRKQAATTKAPRLDLLGMQAIQKIISETGNRRIRRKPLRRWAMAGDVLSNTLYYSWIYSPSPKKNWQKGLVLGTAAGLGAVLLPKPLHLNSKATRRTSQTQILTVGLYLTGALTAAAVQNALKK